MVTAEILVLDSLEGINAMNEYAEIIDVNGCFVTYRFSFVDEEELLMYVGDLMHEMDKQESAPFTILAVVEA